MEAVFIKICGITNADDALLATALGADGLGFIFAPSPRQIVPTRVEEIIRRLPSEVLTVGVFRDEAPSRVIEIVNRCGLKAAQLSGRESMEDTRLIRESVPAVIKAFPGGSPALSVADRYGADIMMVDSDTPGSGRVFDWSLAEGAPGGIRLLMAGGLTPENVATAIAKVRPWGVDVATGVEMSPGRKDPARLRAFINAVRETEPSKPVSEDQESTEDTPYNWQEEDLR